MQLTAILILASASGTLADLLSLSPLSKRQGSCSQFGQKACGTGCIDLTYICCPGGTGGCPITAYCTIGDNGEPACCPNGSVCVGDGGVNTRFNTLTSTITDTQTLPPPEEPTEAPEQPEEKPPAETEEPPAATEEPPVETEEPGVPEETIPPVPLPTPIPSNGTVPPTTTSGEPPVVTGAAIANGLSMSNLVGGLLGVAALFL